jgi:microcystin-dependent protein
MALDPFLGSIQQVAFDFAPVGWIRCNGQTLSIASNTTLFVLLGTNYGGNGITTFALPDLRGRFPIGADQGPGLSLFNLGQIIGSENAQLTLPTMPTHTHAVTVAASTFDGEVSNPTVGSIASKTNRFSPTSNGSLGGTNVTALGSGAAFGIRNPYLGINFCISTQGIFPSRP